MSVALDLRCLIVPVAIPNAVELSTWTVVGGWGCPISSSMIRMGTAFWQFKKKTPTLPLQKTPWCCVVFCRLHKQFRLVLVRNWRYSLVMGVCHSKNACPLICFVLLGRTSRRYHCGPIRPYHCVCIGWLHLVVLQGSWGVGCQLGLCSRRHDVAYYFADYINHSV